MMYKRIFNEAEANRYIDVQIKPNEYDYDYLHNTILELSMDYTKEEIIQQVNMILGEANE